MTSSIREMIDEAKRQADVMDLASSLIKTPDGWVEVKRTVRRPSDTAALEIDPSNVAIAPDKELVAMLFAQLADIRAQKRELDDRDAGIKNILEGLIGDLEYMALEENGRPLFSMKHENSVRIRTAAVKEAFPVDEHPEMYSTVTSRPLRLMS